MFGKRIGKAVKRIIAAHGRTIASMELFLTAVFSIGTCRFLLHQPEEPRELEDFIKKHKNYEEEKR